LDPNKINLQYNTIIKKLLDYLELKLQQNISILMELLQKNTITPLEFDRLEHLYTTLFRDYIETKNKNKQLIHDLSVIVPKFEEEIADKNKQINILLDLIKNQKNTKE